MVDEFPAPGPHAEYLLYQTLLGTWPLEPLDDDAFAKYRERIEEYMVKASREAKRRTSWANVNADYEEALRQFIRLALERRDGNLFATEIGDLARVMARFGFLNSLSQTLCKLTAPGVPDIYQGNEIWDYSLVDPDNRRPVDYEHRKRLLADVKQWSRGLVARPSAGCARVHRGWTLQALCHVTRTRAPPLSRGPLPVRRLHPAASAGRIRCTHPGVRPNAQ